MKFPLLTVLTRSVATRMLVLVLTGISLTMAVSAQATSKGLRILAPEAVGFRLEQCANGKRQVPNVQDPCDTGAEWVTGIVNSSKAHYIEGDSVPYRLIIDGLAPNVPTYVTFSWDSTKGGPHAIDYITSYDRTENATNPLGPSQAIPCAGLTGGAAAICPVGDLNGSSQWPIPLDQNYLTGFPTTPNFPQDNVGEFITLYGGTITGLGRRTSCSNDTPIPDNTNPYLLCGDPASTSVTDITVFFTPTGSDAVLTWGGHISRRADWGIGNAATSISGAPFHTGMITGGSRDVQMQLDAVLFPGQIKIVKEVFTINPIGTESTFQFVFTPSANAGLGASFFLVDDNAGPGVDNVVNSNIQSFYVNGNTATEITVTENNYLNNFHPWMVTDIRCVDTSGGSQLPSSSDSIPQTGTATPQQLAARKATIKLQEGEFVTCTFTNTEQLSPSAAPASVSGRAVDSFGNGIGGATLRLTNAQTGEVHSAITNPFGYYTIDGPEVENFYVLQILHKRYSFIDDMRTFSLHDSISGVDFIANPVE